MKLEALTSLILLDGKKRKMRVQLRRAGVLFEKRMGTVEAASFANQAVYPVRVPSSAKNLGLEGGGRLPYGPEDYVLGLWVLYSDNPRQALLENVEYPSPAFDAGFQVGDKIKAINDTAMAVVSLKKLDEEFLTSSTPSEMLFDLTREGKSLQIRVSPMKWREVLSKIGRRPTKFGSAPSHCPAPVQK